VEQRVKQRIVIKRHGKPGMTPVSREDHARLLTQDRPGEANRVEAEDALAEASRFRERLLTARDSAPLPDSAEIIEATREERPPEVLGEDELTDHD
jgi:hypothetical protein